MVLMTGGVEWGWWGCSGIGDGSAGMVMVLMVWLWRHGGRVGSSGVNIDTNTNNTNNKTHKQEQGKQSRRQYKHSTNFYSGLSNKRAGTLRFPRGLPPPRVFPPDRQAGRPTDRSAARPAD